MKFENGTATLSPLRFHYDTEKFNLPIRLGLVNAKGAQDLIVHILAKGQRYEVANYANVTIPTNFDVSENARGQFATFYASLFDRTLEKTPKAVVTEYAWDASTCDPCPIPALSYNDLATLGADALPDAPPPVAPATGGGGGGAGAAGGGGKGPGIARRPWFSPSGFVLTRLHARYTKEALGEDLVFKQADPITGGREVTIKDNELEHGATPASYNNFQGRYAMRHPWTGPIACQNPKRGRWGGPPAGIAGDMKPKAATNLAFAPRGGAPLASFLAAAVPELDAKPAAAPSATPALSASAAPSAAPTPAPTSSAAPTKSGGCAVSGNAPAGNGVPPTGALRAALALAALVARTRTRTRTKRTRCTPRPHAAR